MCLKLQHPHGPIRTKFLAPDIGMVQLWLLQAFDISAPSHFAFQINLKSELHALLKLMLTVYNVFDTPSSGVPEKGYELTT